MAFIVMFCTSSPTAREEQEYDIPENVYGEMSSGVEKIVRIN